METIGLEIIIVFFFIIALGVCRRANRENIEWLRWTSGIIAVLFAVWGVVELIILLS